MHSRRAKGRILAVCNPWRNVEDGAIDKQGRCFNFCRLPKGGDRTNYTQTLTARGSETNDKPKLKTRLGGEEQKLSEDVREALEGARQMVKRRILPKRQCTPQPMRPDNCQNGHWI